MSVPVDEVVTKRPSAKEFAAKIITSVPVVDVNYIEQRKNPLPAEIMVAVLPMALAVSFVRSKFAYERLVRKLLF